MRDLIEGAVSLLLRLPLADRECEIGRLELAVAEAEIAGGRDLDEAALVAHEAVGAALAAGKAAADRGSDPRRG